MLLMAVEALLGKAHILDLDDSYVGRGKIVRICGLVSGKFKPPHIPNLAPEQILGLTFNHGRVDEPIKSLAERISFEIHARRSVYPGVRARLEKEVEDGTDIFVSTGRHNKGDWVDMTEETLLRGGIRHLVKKVYYTPLGVSGMVSKAHVVGMLDAFYKEIEVDEDDPRAVRYLALRFPEANINYIQHGITNLLLPAEEIDCLKGVKRVPAFG